MKISFISKFIDNSYFFFLYESDSYVVAKEDLRSFFYVQVCIIFLRFLSFHIHIKSFSSCFNNGKDFFKVFLNGINSSHEIV